MDYELHQLIEAAALEAAEPEVAREMYELHAEVSRLPRAATTVEEIAGPDGIATVKSFAAHYQPEELRAEYELSDEQLDRAW